MINNCLNIEFLTDDCLQKLQSTSGCINGINGIASGYHDLDNITSGWQNGDLIVIASRPSMGKSAFALSLIRKMAVDAGIPTLLFSLEMNNFQLVNRLIVNICDLPIEKIKSGRLAPYEWGKLDYKIKDLKSAPLFIEHVPDMEIEILCNEAKKAVEKHDIKIICIDYIQRISVRNADYDKRYLEINYIARKLKTLALELNVPVVVLSQLNRNGEHRVSDWEKRPVLTDLRDSGTLEDDADVVIFVHRPEYYKIYQDDRGNDLRGMAEIIIAKHRNGVVGDVLLRFCGEKCRFENLEEKTIFSEKGNIPLPPSFLTE